MTESEKKCLTQLAESQAENEKLESFVQQLKEMGQEYKNEVERLQSIIEIAMHCLKQDAYSEAFYELGKAEGREEQRDE